MYGLIVLVIYFIVMMGMTLVLTKKELDNESFHVSDRKMGALSSGMSIAATWIWAPAIFVSAERAYLNGIPGLFWFTVPNVLCLIIFIPFAKLIREQMPKGITLSGYMGSKYKSNSVRNTYLFQLGTLAVFSTAVNLLAGGKILSRITGLSFPLVTILLTLIAYAYSQFSGIKAAVMTDNVKMIIIIVGSLIFAPWLFKITGGIENISKGLTGISGEYTSFFSGKGLDLFFAFGLPTAIGLISGPFGDQCFWQRAFTIKENKIGKAFFIGALMFAIMPLSMGLIGYIAAGSGYVAIDSSMVNFEIIMNLLPHWTGALFLFIVLSGLLSTIDSNLCAMASLTTDFIKNSSVRTSKFSMVMLLILGIAIANIPGITVTHLFLFYGTFRASTLLPTVMTLKGIKLSARGITIGVKAALLLGLPIFAYGNIFNMSSYKTMGSLITVLTSGVLAFLISRREVMNI
ncbi:hypothetical protein [uncultured Tissierella sp.]|uniref:sodium:solute symporter family protein n=1 Tax=uncultured Tissierella sp. TaxID=448160 RepID=UPI002805BCF7|nr:hypothetical protein [uncultured Tissierella sp.]MDU5080249.1 hypothetical protein [Bacillota bacterium]